MRSRAILRAHYPLFPKRPSGQACVFPLLSDFSHLRSHSPPHLPQVTCIVEILTVTIWSCTSSDLNWRLPPNPPNLSTVWASWSVTSKIPRLPVFPEWPLSLSPFLALALSFFLSCLNLKCDYFLSYFHSQSHVDSDCFSPMYCLSWALKVR